MNFITYENKNNPHVTIHCAGCNQIAKRGGRHTTGKGKYEDHNTYQDAKQYAGSTGLPVINCSFCTPPQCIRDIKEAKEPQ
jgi:hypothetical protein